jgi:hypothetical protein
MVEGDSAGHHHLAGGADLDHGPGEQERRDQDGDQVVPAAAGFRA